MPAENKDLTRDMILRVSPKRNTLIVEEQKPGGAVACKEISPLELYFAINSCYTSRDFLCSGFLPENCLHVSMNSVERHFILWNPELRADITYKDTTYPNFPLPRLVFGVRMLEGGKVAECSIGVVADEKPSPETPMFHYPFSNVYADGTVCSGNNIMPCYRKLQALRNFPRYLLELPDNDDMYNPANNKLGLKHRNLLELLKDKDPAFYYSDILVPNKKTLDDFICGR